MKYFGCIGLLFVVLTVQANPVNLPSGLHSCKRGIPNFSECIEKAVDKAMILLASGSKRFGIPPLEPLVFDNRVQWTSYGSVSYTLTREIPTLHGFTKGFKSSNFNIDFDKLSISFETWNPKVELTANFSIQGHDMSQNFHSYGYSLVTLAGLRTKQTMHCEKYEKDNEIFLKIKKYDVTLEPENFRLDLVDLSRKNGTIGYSEMLKSDQDWKIWSEQIRPINEGTLSRIFTNIANEAFAHIPMDTLFPY